MLADDFWLIAHHDATGKPRLHGGATGLGLAAALLGELALEGRIAVHDGAVMVIDRRAPADGLAHTVLDHLLAEPQHRGVRVWLSFLATAAAGLVGARLERGGLVSRVESRRLWRTTVRYVPLDMSAAAWPQHRLRLHLTRGEPMTIVDAVLIGLVSAAGLAGHVFADISMPRRFNHQVIGSLPPSLRELVVHTDAAVGDAVLSHRT